MAEPPDDADPGSVPDPGPVSSRHRQAVLLLAGIAAVVVILDQIVKALVVAHLVDGESKPILGGLVYLSLYRNAGAAFSMATGMTWILTLVVIAVVVGIIRMATKLRSIAWAVVLGLILGGAVGNLIDRLFRAPGFLRGHVVDFISLFGPDGRYFAIFNVADSAITCGAVALVIVALLGVEVDGSRRSSRRTALKSEPGPHV